MFTTAQAVMADPKSAVLTTSGSTDMPMKVKYTVLDGEIISENRGGTISDYVPDSLGSTRFLLNSSQSATDSWNYWPYGEAVQMTGTNRTPMQFVGTAGYYTTSAMRAYVREQECWRKREGKLVDGGSCKHYWVATLNLYRYVGNGPVVKVDPSGLDDTDTVLDVCGLVLGIIGFGWGLPPVAITGILCTLRPVYHHVREQVRENCEWDKKHPLPMYPPDANMHGGFDGCTIVARDGRVLGRSCWPAWLVGDGRDKYNPKGPVSTGKWITPKGGSGLPVYKK